MRNQVSGDSKTTFSTKINELVNQIASSSESLNELCLKMSSDIQKLHEQHPDKSTDAKDQVTKSASISTAANVIHEESKQSELEPGKKSEATNQEEGKKSEEDPAKKN